MNKEDSPTWAVRLAALAMLDGLALVGGVAALNKLIH
jgi:hypothetical protein